MLRKRDEIDLDEFKKFGFKYGSRNKFSYKTTSNKQESTIYIDLVPCNNNHNEIKIKCSSYSIPEKITDKLYDLITAGLIEKSR